MPIYSASNIDIIINGRSDKMVIKVSASGLTVDKDLIMLCFLRVCTLCVLFVAMNFSAEQDAKVLFLLEKGFNRGEHFPIYHALDALGYEVDIASPTGGVVFTRLDATPDPKGRDVDANLRIAEVEIEDYLSVVVPGGYSPPS